MGDRKAGAFRSPAPNLHENGRRPYLSLTEGLYDLHPAVSFATPDPGRTAFMRILARFVPALAAALLPVLPPVGAAQQTDATSVDAAILDILLQRGLIDQAQYDELVQMVRDKAESSRSEIDLIEGRLARLRAPDVQTS